MSAEQQYPAAKPRCVVIMLPMPVRKFRDYLLPDVPVDDQTYVMDPQDERWLHVVHDDDAAAMRDWLKWYHASKQG